MLSEYKRNQRVIVKNTKEDMIYNSINRMFNYK